MEKRTAKVCFAGPTRMKVAEELLKKAGCELVLGKSIDDFPEFRYQRRKFIDLIGDSVDPARLILTPHIIGNNPKSLESGQRMAADSILTILRGDVPATVLNRDAIGRWRGRFWG